MPASPSIGNDQAGTNPEPFVLSEVLDISVAQNMRSELLARVAADTPLTIDASRVEKIGTAAIQLLHAAGLARAVRGKSMIVKNPTPAFVAGFTDIGFAADLNNWSAN